ncbi:GNAT family N-acetyltransferase, partial [Chromobacterium piscinae]
MMTLPLLKGVRLKPDFLHEDDFPRYLALYSDPRISVPTGMPRNAETDIIRHWFNTARALALPQGQVLALRRVGSCQLDGILQLMDLELKSGLLTIGYSLMPNLWGQGLMSECLRAMLPELMSGLLGGPLTRIQAWVMVNNDPSHRLLANLGFQHEGTLRQLFHDGQLRQDICIYGLLNTDLAQITGKYGSVAVSREGRVESGEISRLKPPIHRT